MERATGIGRRTREEIVKWNKMTAREFQTEGRHQTSPAFLRGLTENKIPNLYAKARTQHNGCLKRQWTAKSS